MTDPASGYDDLYNSEEVYSDEVWVEFGSQDLIDESPYYLVEPR